MHKGYGGIINQVLIKGPAFTQIPINTAPKPQNPNRASIPKSVATKIWGRLARFSQPELTTCWVVPRFFKGGFRVYLDPKSMSSSAYIVREPLHPEPYNLNQTLNPTLR